MKCNPRTVTALAGALAVATALAACGGGSADDGASGGDVTIEFFQSKSEAVGTVDQLISDFEASHPGITVEQNNTPDALTVLQTRLAKGDVPDVIGVNVSNLYDVVQAGILKDLSGTEAAEAVTDHGALDYVATAGQTDEQLALPWATNAQVVLYNKDVYADLGLSVPTTWDEFLANAQAVQDAGQNPFYFTWKDSWTAKLVLNSIAGNLQPADFLDQLQDGTATFADSDAYQETADKLIQLKAFAQDDPFGKGYDDGNAAFADGQAAMYVQGIWAIPEITAVNPDVSIGAFVMPVTDDADDTKILSGPDSVIGIAQDSEHADAAQEFVDYLFSKEGQETFANGQHLFSVRDDVVSDDELLAPLKADWIDAGRTAAYPDGMFTGSSDLAAIVQDFLYQEDTDTFLSQIDTDWSTNGLK